MDAELEEMVLARIAEATARSEHDEDPLPDVANLHTAWPTLTIEQQRLVVPLAVNKIVIKPGERGGGSLRHASAD